MRLVRQHHLLEALFSDLLLCKAPMFSVGFCSLLLFEFILPTFQIVLFCLCIGRTPFGLNVAVVNNDTSSASLSTQYLSFLSSETIVQVCNTTGRRADIVVCPNKLHAS
jgi:hypothetical protein